MFNYHYGKEVIHKNNIFNLNITKKSGVDLDILSKILAEFDFMVTCHSKVLVLRFELFANQKLDNNRLISKLIKRLKKKLATKKINLTRFGYAWCREISQDRNNHYHLVFFLNGNEFRSGHVIEHNLRKLIHIEKSLNLILSKSPQSPELYKRGDASHYAKIVYWISYLAKQRSKDLSGNCNRYSTSRNALEISPIFPASFEVLAAAA